MQFSFAEDLGGDCLCFYEELVVLGEKPTNILTK